MTVYQEVSSNKTKSILIIAGFFIFLLGLSYLFAELTGFGIFGLAFALVFAVIVSFGSYYWSDSIVLRISNAREATHDEYRLLDNLVEGLAIAAGIPKPRIYVIDDTALNAFATGRNPQRGVICITSGLLQKLNRNELEGVLAHEMSHIKNLDIRFMTLVTVMVGVTVLLSDFLLRSFLWGNNRRQEGKAGIALILLGLLLAILAPIIATLVQLAISRKREYLADASSVLLTRYPQGLISALQKLDADKEPLEAANKATAHLYISDPLKNNNIWFKSLFATHPAIEDRISALKRM